MADLTQRISGLRGTTFQNFCSVLLAAADQGFQAVDGRAGDEGVDGFRVAGDTMYQAYAPDERNGKRTVRKIRETVKLAAARKRDRLPSLRRVIFITPFDLQLDESSLLLKEAKASGLEGLSWGASHLAEKLAAHVHVARAFPELQLADVIEEVRMLGRQPTGTSEWSAIDRAKDEAAHHIWLSSVDEGSERYEDRRCVVQVRSGALFCPSIEPSDEDRFLEAIGRTFEQDAQGLAFCRRDDHGVWVQHRPDDLRFHRGWAWFRCGLLGFAMTIADLHNPGRYSVTDLALDLLRAMRLGATLTRMNVNCSLRVSFAPYDLRPRSESSDVRMRRSIDGVTDYPRMPNARGLPFHWESNTSLGALLERPHVAAASFFSAALRHLHGSRVYTDRLGESLMLLEDEAQRAAKR